MKFWPFIVLAFVVAASCSDQSTSGLTPPPNIPPNARATGGLDGLHWTVCEKLSKTDFACDIYRGSDGKKMLRGWYRLCLSESAFQSLSNGGIISDSVFDIDVRAVAYRKPVYFNGFEREHIAEKWNPIDSELDQECLDIYPQVEK